MSSKARSSVFFRSYRSDVEKYLFSPSAIDEFLQKAETAFGLSGLGVKLSLHGVDHRWGNCSGKGVLTERFADVDGNVQVYLSVGSDSNGVEVQQNLHNLLEIFKLMWTKECRNKHGGLNLKQSGTEDLFFAAIRNLRDINASDMYSIIYIDLDHFKPINDECSHEVGDKVLRKVYAEMHELARKLKGFSFFDGGDEFILVFPNIDRLEISSGLWSLLKIIKAEEYGEKKLKIGFTAGVVARAEIEILSSFQEVKNECEKLTKNKDLKKTKRRGTISFENGKVTLPAGESKVSLLNFYKLGISLSRSLHYKNNPFEDERLNLIVDQVCDFYSGSSGKSSLDDAVSEIIAWFGSTLTNDLFESSLLYPAASYATISKNAVTIAVAHGLARALEKCGESAIPNLKSKAKKGKISQNIITIKWNISGKKTQVTLDGVKCWGDELPSKVKGIDYGIPIKQSTDKQNTGLFAGVQIGFDKKALTPGGNELPVIFLADHIKVDMRPKTGGGLPDFWQVAIAQVVSCLGKSDVDVLVWGDATNTSETYKKLIKPHEWFVDEIAHLTGLDSEIIRSVSAKIKEKVIKIKSADHLLDQIYSSYRKVTEFVSQESFQDNEIRDPLPRPMASTIPLSQSEGVVCSTAAIAYPIIIDTLRKSQGLRSSIDDSGQDQKELIAFKLKLTAPAEDPIPRYLKKQKSELNNYAEDVLLKPDGVIRKYLEKTHQTSAFIKHLSTYIGDSKKRSTRRACMVVPHAPDEHAADFPTPRPWGLISIWATPRYTENGVFLDFAFVWRTVEAFIGLPYSLYGSIRLAEQMVENIKSQLPKSENLMLGELNYIALSLHLGGDQFHSRVAKQIVDLASD